MLNELRLKNEYFIGGLNQIKRGNRENLPRTFNLEKAKSLFEKRKQESLKIITPKIIGVYRTLQIGPLDNEGGSEEYRRDIFLEESSEVHHNLVQIGYDPLELTPTMIYDFLGQENGRIKIMPYLDLDPGAWNLKLLSNANQKKWKSFADKYEFTEEELKETVKILKEMRKKDGLSLLEEEVLNSPYSGEN